MKLGKLKPRLPKLFRKKAHRPGLFDAEPVLSALDNSISNVEAAFGHLSQNISDIHERTQFLRRDCQTLLRLAGGHQNGASVLLEAAKTLEEPMAHIENSLSKRKKLGALMAECEEIADNLLHRQKDMIGKLQPLKFMLVFYKIEAANLSAEHQSTFITVSKEIMRLHQMVDETFRKNIEQLTHAKGKIAHAIRRFDHEHSKHSKEVSAQRKEISNTIATLNQQLERNSLQDTDLNHVTQSFQGAIEGLVVSLQIEDIFRQRCEAIKQSLAEKPCGISSQAWALLNARKLDTASSEIAKSSKDVEESLASILAQSNELDQVSVGMQQFEHMTASADGMVQILLESFDSMKEVFVHSEKLSNESREAVSPVKSLVEGLSVIVTEVSINIQFIALNAQVRSIQVGEGSGLEVLAARTAEISAQLRELGSSTARDIEKIQTAVESLSSLIDEDHSSNAVQSRKLEDSGSAMVEQLHQLRDQTFDSLSQVADTMNGVRSLVETGQQKLVELPSVAEQLSQCSQSIRTQTGIDKLSSTQLKKLEDEIASQIEETEKASHTSISGAKQSTATLWENDRMSAEADTPAMVAGDVELF
ncbi:MAG: methyl-accepting chemotaxis protein [Verrucomicrobiota bacterium]